MWNKEKSLVFSASDTDTCEWNFNWQQFCYWQGRTFLLVTVTLSLVELKLCFSSSLDTSTSQLSSLSTHRADILVNIGCQHFTSFLQSSWYEYDLLCFTKLSAIIYWKLIIVLDNKVSVAWWPSLVCLIVNKCLSSGSNHIEFRSLRSNCQSMLKFEG